MPLPRQNDFTSCLYKQATTIYSAQAMISEKQVHEFMEHIRPRNNATPSSGTYKKEGHMTVGYRNTHDLIRPSSACITYQQATNSQLCFQNFSCALPLPDMMHSVSLDPVSLEAFRSWISIVTWSGVLTPPASTVIEFLINILSNHVQWFSLHLYQLSVFAFGKDSLNSEASLTISELSVAFVVLYVWSER
jgi:hypothetical protein